MRLSLGGDRILRSICATRLGLAVFNRIFHDSLFPESWRYTLVVFIPKTGTGKFRPISLAPTLCKLFERLMQRRIEHMAKNGDWIPHNQYGFRRGRSSLDCVILFIFHLRLLNRFLPPDVRAAMYADDFQEQIIVMDDVKDDVKDYVRGTNSVRALSLMESTMNSPTSSLGSLGLSISIPKCQLCDGMGDVSIRAGDSLISFQPSLKYLGVILDARLTWDPHIRYIATVYRNLGRSYLECVAPLFHCASKSALFILDRAWYGTLRAALGCMRTPTSVLLSEAGEPPLSLRRSLL